MSSDIISKLKELDDLPALPQTAKKVIDILNKPDFSFAELVSVISKDMNITASILKLANSALYSPKSEIRNLTQAITFLGATNIKNLVIALSTKTLFENFKASLLIQKVWEHSVAVAIYSRIVALKISNKISEEVFLIGMLHDLGIIIMNQYIKNYEEMISEIYGTEESLYEKEKELFDITHAEVGAKLVELWNLPGIYSDAIKYHHSSEDSKYKEYTKIVEYSDLVLSKNNMNIVSFTDENRIEQLRNEFGIDVETSDEIDEMFNEVYQYEKELFKL
ncbi:metal dependent phosphohydrolase [Deferribacter desulfuricans SSM1]|uniref:Metal dependent phosphohydrolase n=1 Tax=Deferribacter desulfuricans (strain DSM 14783 / JCM 11476 / NBRC 101012 / SSM1) TaxID=639282 RepID=D3PB52_DEFDS|nr:HDOD domain-containing protein [Deferribacter desulfuricans]BAI79825.1 metal dependent phosphohydrolase [Deferribacter desulfuricans SSM1]